jgi:hypothetical protein
MAGRLFLGYMLCPFFSLRFGRWRVREYGGVKSTAHTALQCWKMDSKLT